MDEPPVEDLRVLTFNALSPPHADWPSRRPVVRAGLRALRPDVVGLQEVDPDEVADLLGPGYHLAPHPTRAGDGSGAVLASRWPVRVLAELDLDVTDRTAPETWYSTAVAEVDCPMLREPLLVVHHKPHWQLGHERERELQAVQAARCAEAQVTGDDQPVVLLGDLDAAPDAASIRFLMGRQSLDGTSVAYRDAWSTVHGGDPGHTFTPENPLVREGDMPLDPGRRIDYVMVRCGDRGPVLRVLACERVFVEPVDGVQASDHYGLLATLRPA